MDELTPKRARLQDRDIILAAGLVLIAIAGLALRLWFASHRDLWYDELVIWQISQGGLVDILAKNRSLNLAPPLYPILVNLASYVLGSGELALRSISLAAGLLSIPAGYLAGRAVFNNAAGWVSAALAALTTNLVQYSAELREYTLVALLVFIFVWLLARAETGLRRWVWWAGILLILAALIWTQYGAAIVAVSGAVVLAVFTVIRRKEVQSWPAGLVALMVVLGLSILTVYFIGLRYQATSGEPFYLPDAYLDRSGGTLKGLLRLVDNTRGIFAFALGTTEPFYYLLLGLAVIGVIALLVTHRARHLVFLALAGLSWLATFALAVLGKYPYTGRRHDMMLVPFALLLAAYALSLLFERGKAGAVAGAILTAVLLAGPLLYQAQGQSWLTNQPFSQVLARLANLREASQPILLTPFARPAMDYYGPGFSGEIIDLPSEFLTGAPVEQCVKDHAGGCWVVYAHCWECEAQLASLPKYLRVKEQAVIEGGFVGAVLLQRQKP